MTAVTIGQEWTPIGAPGQGIVLRHVLATAHVAVAFATTEPGLDTDSFDVWDVLADHGVVVFPNRSGQTLWAIADRLADVSVLAGIKTPPGYQMHEISPNPGLTPLPIDQPEVAAPIPDQFDHIEVIQ